MINHAFKLSYIYISKFLLFFFTDRAMSNTVDEILDATVILGN